MERPIYHITANGDLTNANKSRLISRNGSQLISSRINNNVADEDSITHALPLETGMEPTLLNLDDGLDSNITFGRINEELNETYSLDETVNINEFSSMIQESHLKRVIKPQKNQ